MSVSVEYNEATIFEQVCSFHPPHPEGRDTAAYYELQIESPACSVRSD